MRKQKQKVRKMKYGDILTMVKSAETCYGVIPIGAKVWFVGWKNESFLSVQYVFPSNPLVAQQVTIKGTDIGR